MTRNLKFDNEMKQLSMGVYNGNEKYIPKDWIKIGQQDSQTGFHGEAFYKNGVVVLAYRGLVIFKCVLIVFLLNILMLKNFMQKLVILFQIPQL